MYFLSTKLRWKFLGAVYLCRHPQCVCTAFVSLWTLIGCLSPVHRYGCQLWRRTVGYGEGRGREVLQQLQGQPEGHAERHVHQGHAPGFHVSHQQKMIFRCTSATFVDFLLFFF